MRTELNAKIYTSRNFEQAIDTEAYIPSSLLMFPYIQTKHDTSPMYVEMESDLVIDSYYIHS